ncbi:TNF receptor-associated factor 3 isoform X2 [Patella vulgata]|uniref:TNF receptor-associated factor 3 isoform X2 n=1 Tax=Patella vulgata TaxID=6465 RepID=UPI0021804856|nr:TNF receptor-associated factor 3 isoform X2 [Patella vulgata]
MQRRNLPQHLEGTEEPVACDFTYFGCKKMSVANVTDDIKAKILLVENGIKDLKLNLAGITEKVTTMERKLADLPSQVDFEQPARDIVDIKGRVATLSEQYDTFTHHLHGNTEISIVGMNRLEGALEQACHNETLIQNHDGRIAEMGQRFQILEAASYNGVIIWKIKDYMRIKQDAVNGRILALNSRPFYTSKYGYKMCVRAFLDGDGMGQNTHVSLLFVVMGGEFDALLPWPFQQKVTLYIMDQGPGKRHLSDHFHPDATSTSFRRPVSEMNVASGCPLFVSHTVLESNSNQYIKDDTLFIRCNVDLNGLDNV